MGRRLSELAYMIGEGLLQEHFDKANWSVGKQPTILRVPDGKGGTVLKVKAIPIHVDMNVIYDDTQLQQAKTIRFKDVFDTWKRVSIKSGNPHSTPEEENAWTYDAVTDKVTCTVNSASIVGFISADQYDDFTFEVEFISTNGDDDSMGLMLAYVEEGAIAHSLMVYRAASTVVPTGQNPAMPFAAAYEGPAAQKYVIGGVVGNLQFPNGTPIPPEGITSNGGFGGWNVHGAVKIKVVRKGTSLTCYTTNKGSEVYEAINSFTIDLTKDSRLARFTKPCAFGYIAYSQPATTYRAIQQPGLGLPIYDARDGSVWRYSNGTWLNSPSLDNLDIIFPGQMVRSDLTGKFFYVNEDMSLSIIGEYSK